MWGVWAAMGGGEPPDSLTISTKRRIRKRPETSRAALWLFWRQWSGATPLTHCPGDVIGWTVIYAAKPSRYTDH